jgi:hypothetical protein
MIANEVIFLLKDQEMSWWDPPAVTAWPAPKPDTWVETNADWQAEQDPIPEWKVQVFKPLSVILVAKAIQCFKFLADRRCISR